jgi:predicted enzyme related to lactoylglutathione lyase/uncharacterized protein YndB with AHSA1/START domain
MAAKTDPDTTLELSRDFKSGRERVFSAFLDAAVLQAIWSNEAYKIVEMTVDPRVGGGWKLAMRDEASGSIGHCTARFAEIEKPSRIVWFTKWLDGPLAAAPEARVTLEFIALEAGTRLKLTHEFFPDRQTRDHHGQGWGSGLDRLARVLADSPVERHRPTMANGKICYIEIPVIDIDQSAKFYNACFGWQIRRRTDGHIAFDDAVSEVSGTWVVGRKASTDPGLLIYIMVDQIESTIAAILANGGKIVQPVGADAPEITARFSDPAGNVLGLYQHPKGQN